jgi:hypothetical protein
MVKELEELRIEIIRKVDEVFQKASNLIIVKLAEDIEENKKLAIAEFINDSLEKTGKLKEVIYV